MRFHGFFLENENRITERCDPYYDITDLKHLCSLKSYYKPYMGPYGVGRSLLQFMGYGVEKRLTCPIEHGVQVQDSFVTQEEVSGASGALVTYSRFRQEVIERLSDKKGIPVGSYIYYASDYKSREEIKSIKKRLGRTLLVFNVHSIPGLHFNYDVDSYIKEIRRIAVDFNTVLISVYYYDHIIGIDKPFKTQEFQLVSAGKNNSPYFISRMKFILQLSDAVMSNGFTSGLSYAVSLSKPVYIYDKGLTIKQQGFNNVQIFNYNRIMEFNELCRSSHFDNLEDQRKWGEYYFGVNGDYSSEDLRILLKNYVRDDRRIV